MIKPGSELDRVRLAYEYRSEQLLDKRYSRTNPGHLYAIHEKEASMATLLCSRGLISLAGLRILDLGCGTGATLRQYLEYGADPMRLWGIDLLQSRVQQARSTSMNLHFLCGSAAQLPFPDETFDLVSQFTLFTSVLNPEIKLQIAREIDRVLVTGGKFLWYDFAHDNPWNSNVRGIGLAEVRRLFPKFSITSRKITLAPPFGRSIGRFGPAFYYFISKIRFLCTHYLCLLEKQSSA
jgi:ubiquinone/menaquinone biosynthesis C-methylase UbiE